MAVKKTVKDTEVTVEETVEVDVAEETKGLEVTPEVADIEVDTKEVEEPKTTGNVRIRMLKDHRCYIGGEHYVLSKGQCYNVPVNVKDVLNNAGLLSPL